MGEDRFSIAGWLMRGAIREDDHNELNIGVCHIDPPNLNVGDDDPHPSPPDRPIHHFYDPINDEGLFAGVSRKNPDWAIGVSDAFAPAIVEDLTRRNHFTVYDAMESMYRALTGRRSADGSTDIGPDNAVPPMTNEEVRKAYWATTFRALGDVVHLIEDVAQPQHTREDPHSGDCWDIASGVVGHASFFERYLEARITQETNAVDKVNETGVTVTVFPTLEIGDYPKPTFDRYSYYWSTREGLNGRGMADYSNREFFSAGRNLGDKKVPLSGPYYYDKPSNNHNDYGAFYSWDDEEGGYHTYLEHTVTDKQNPVYTTTSIATKQSIFLDDSETYQIEKYTLNQDIYDTQAELLLPRAVAYSAGLIDYFFRGRLKVRAVTEADATHLRVVVENASKWPDEDTGISFLAGGTFSFYYTTNDGSRVLLPISQAVYSGGTDPMVNAGVADLQVDMPVQITEPGDSTIEFVIDKPGADVSTTEYSPLVVVYKGAIGQEEGIAASVFSSGGLMTFMRADASINSFVPLLSEDLGDHWKRGVVVPDEEDLINKYAIYYLTYLGEQRLLGSGINESGQPVVYRSEDLGRTWAITPDTAPMMTPDNFYLIKHNKKVFTGGTELVKLNVSPGATNVNGHYSDYTVYYSHDSGLTWTTGSAITGISHPRDLIYLGRTGNTLALPTPEGETKEKAFAFIGEYESAVTGNDVVGVFRSDDGGVTWQRANTIEFDGSATYIANDSTVTHKANYNMVYLGADRLLINHVSVSGTDYLNKFYISDDRGATWTYAGTVPAPNDKFSYNVNASKVMSLVYLGNNKVYSQVGLELVDNGLHVLFLEYPNYESYLLTTAPGSSLVVDDSVTELNYAEELIPIQGNTTNKYEKEIYYPFVFSGDNGAIPGLYE